MPRYGFYSFHYELDAWRASQVRNIGAIEGNKPANDNDWEEVKRGGDKAIEKWINNQLSGKSCVIVLIGHKTASRKWINYEIKQGWNTGKGVLGIHIHGLKDSGGKTTQKGSNPFDDFTIETDGFLGKQTVKLSSVIPAHDPFGWDSSGVYASIKSNMEKWIEDAIEIRSRHK